jgi:signal peptidase II
LTHYLQQIQSCSEIDMTSSYQVAVLVSGIGFFLLDQFTKRMVYSRCTEDQAGGHSVPRFRRVAHREDFYEHDGARVLLVVLWFAALAACILLSRSGGWLHTSLARFGLALTLAGAAGNLADILRWHYVLDFVDFGWWPVFNLADVGIVGGFLLVLCAVF